MTASSRGSRAAASMIRSSTRPGQSICSDCISLLRNMPSNPRGYAIAATALKTSEPTPDSELKHVTLMPLKGVKPGVEYTTKAGIVLSRPPLVTRRLSNFEKAFFFYQKRLNERLVMPFTRYFYFRKDTPADADWKIKAKERNGAAARELGGYKAYGDMAWNDELLVQEGKSMGIAEPAHIIETLVKDAKIRAVEGKDGTAVEIQEGEKEDKDEEVRPLSRITEADRQRDTRRLDRQLERTLYLLVRKEKGGWGFPSAELIGRENLHQAAERIIVQAGGINMNTWVVGHVPIGHFLSKPLFTERSKLARLGEKCFFMKGRILAGQADIKANALGLTDFKWLTREEVQKHVGARYWSHVKNMLANR